MLKSAVDIIVIRTWKWKVIDLIRKTGRVRYGFPNLLSNLEGVARAESSMVLCCHNLEKRVCLGLSLDLHCKRIHTFYCCSVICIVEGKQYSFNFNSFQRQSKT